MIERLQQSSWTLFSPLMKIRLKNPLFCLWIFTLKQKEVKIKGEINWNWTLTTGHLIGRYLMEVQLNTIFMKKIKNFKKEYGSSKWPYL